MSYWSLCGLHNSVESLTFKRQMANCVVAAINQTFKGQLPFGSWNDRVENHAAYPLPIEGEMPLVSFAAVFRDVTQRSPERNGCSHSNHIPFQLCFKQPIKSVNCEWCNFRARVMWAFRVAAWDGEWNAEKNCGRNLKVFLVFFAFGGPKKEYLFSAIVPIILWK